MEEKTGNMTKSLWTRDFTIITIGSVVSMFGNSMAGFAMSLMVLDISESTLLYSIYIAMFTLPQLIMPIVSIGTCILVGWVLKPGTIIDEVTKNGESFKRKGVYTIMVRFVAPVLLFLILLRAIV